jgi:hypothetical protein
MQCLLHALMEPKVNQRRPSMRRWQNGVKRGGENGCEPHMAGLKQYGLVDCALLINKAVFLQIDRPIAEGFALSYLRLSVRVT